MKKKTKLSEEQIKLAEKLKIKLVDKQLRDQLKATKKSSNKTILILGALLLVTLSLALSFLKSDSKAAQSTLIDKTKLISTSLQASFSPPFSQLPVDLKSTLKQTIIHPPHNTTEMNETLILQRECIIKYGLPLEVENKFGMKFRLIPPGQFLMGSPQTEANRTSTELLHESEIKYPFYLQKFETIQKTWQAVTNKNPAKTPKPDFPIQDVSFNDCLFFFQALNTQLNLAQHSYTLPSEKEWEYATRAGSHTPWHFGKDLKLAPAYVISKYNAFPRYEKNHLLPNAFGLFNTHGNMQEFTRSPFFIYECKKDQYAHSWDFKIYDGDHPEDIVLPRNNFKVETRSQGRQTGLYFHDANNDGLWTNSEIIWAAKDPLDPIYKSSRDTFIWRGDQNKDTDLTSFDKLRGVNGNLYYNDKNADLSWSPGEEIWGYNEWKRYKSGYQIVRGGAWSLELKYSRSAMRFTHSNNDKGSYIGMRSCRPLYKLKELPLEQQSKNRAAWDSFQEGLTADKTLE
ncbi:formylglycine-generating enzyme family protein [Lentisphaera profundi]|uniref:Formylglycine-generating enzyme family protein n=1 Tax=Lentisphaera profundi TaxID=1658616 RepID=A0ABY7VU35_9BACT|nr:formylglycine-generating enzyme family protein [Lentisphaera profundi]WDE96730.1 formylglycine-generating enzyme family protein [Lentisphaera profundi]